MVAKDFRKLVLGSVVHLNIRMFGLEYDFITTIIVLFTTLLVSVSVHMIAISFAIEFSCDFIAAKL